MAPTGHSLLLTTENAPGTLSQITRVIAEHPANIRSIESLGQRGEEFTVYLELDPADDFAGLRDALAALPVIRVTDSGVGNLGAPVPIIGPGSTQVLA